MRGHHFISYSTADARDFAFELYEALRSGDPPFGAWLDNRNLHPGVDWDDQIVDAIRTCRSLLFVMSGDSVARGSVTKDEWTIALQYKKPIIPLLLDPSIEVPFRLGNRQYLDFSDEFEPAVERLRGHLAWLDSPEGKLYQLQCRLVDAQRDMRRARDEKEESRIHADIADLEKAIAAQQQIVEDLESAAKRTQETIDRGIERRRQPRKPVTAATRARFINRPPGVAPNYFQDRHVETKLIRDFLRDDARRLLTIVGRAGVGKTALACRLLKGLEGGQLPDDLGELLVDGIVYLSARGSREISAPNLLADLCRLLPEQNAEELNTLCNDPKISAREKVNSVLAAFADGCTVVLLDNFEDLVDLETREVKSTELSEALHAFLDVPQHAVKIILTTRVAPRNLALVHPERQMPLLLDEGLKSPYAENILREMDADGTFGLKDAPDELLARGRERTLGYPRALEALFAILAADRHTTLDELLKDAEKLLPDNVVEVLVGEAFSRLDESAQTVLEALAVYGRPVPSVAVDYLLQPHLPGVNSAPVLNRLVNMQFVRKEASQYYLHPVDRAYALGRVRAGGKSDRGVPDASPFTQYALRHRAANFFQRIRKPRSDWKTVEDLVPQLAEFELRCAGDDYDTAAELLGAIDHEYLRRWGHAQLVIRMRERLAGQLQSPALVTRNAGALAGAYWNVGRFDEALVQYDAAISKARAHSEFLLAAVYQENLALVYWDLGDLERALELLSEIRPIVERFWGKESLAGYLGDTGIVHLYLGNLTEAIQLFHHAERLAAEAGADRVRACNLDNLAQGSLRKGEYENAKHYIARALAMPIEKVGSLNACYHLVTSARVRLTLSEYRAAIEDCQAAIDLNEPSLRHRASLYMAIANLFLGQAEAARENARQAVRSVQSLFAHIKRHRDAGYFLAIALLCAGQAEDALQAYRHALAMCSAEGVVSEALLDLQLLQKLQQAPEATAPAVALLRATLAE
ncbi:MAG TPA: TIR domain-containing protein [Thermoguttaceae bacterium]|nr:TIR domain-containing protein [Thermoguttaceae bacterium]